MLSVIVPAYNEELSVERAYHTISGILKDADIDNEIIFVDDGSKDKTYEKLLALSESVSGMVGLHFSRNFGKEAAISAGLAAAKGDCAVVIDCDLQHPPEKIVEMYRLWQEGFEIVEGVKSSRGKEGKAHGFAAKTFYSIISRVIGFDMSNASDFKLLDRKVVDVINSIPEKRGFFRAISFWVGYNKTSVEYEVNERLEGETKWSTVGLIKYAITNITSFSTAPMQIVTVLGCILAVLSVALGIWVGVDGICDGGFSHTGIIVSVLSFVGSVIMMALGIIGYYIARIYEEIKGRPKYIVSSVCKSK